jgi:hypothetical protein
LTPERSLKVKKDEKPRKCFGVLKPNERELFRKSVDSMKNISRSLINYQIYKNKYKDNGYILHASPLPVPLGNLCRLLPYRASPSNSRASASLAARTGSYFGSTRGMLLDRGSPNP